jgi:hypothetical protein
MKQHMSKDFTKTLPWIKHQKIRICLINYQIRSKFAIKLE